MTLPAHAEKLSHYADLAVQVGLNLQPGQHLAVTASGFGPELTPFLRQLTESAYRTGAAYVDVVATDDALGLIRLSQASLESLEYVPRWRIDRLTDTVARGGAILSVIAPDPNLFAGQDPQRIGVASKAQARAGKPVQEALMREEVNWLGVAIPSPPWADLVFPDLPAEQRIPRLWEAIFTVLRLHLEDPVAAWREHIAQLTTRRLSLARRQYQTLAFRGPGTDLTVGLLPEHLWLGGRVSARSGIDFTPNLPTEEIFTLPHRDRTEGVVRATKPLSLHGVLVEDFSLKFSGGRVVEVTAAKGGEVLRRLLQTDEGAVRLGEVALVPHGSPVSQSGLLFYNTLYDENAACHIALGNGIKGCLPNGPQMSSEEFAAAGGNESMIHVDFMIGSDRLDVDGLRADGSREPVLRGGEWAFEV